MVQVPGKGEIGRPATVAFGARSGETGIGSLTKQAPAADAEQPLDPVDTLAHDGRVARIGLPLHRDERRAEGVVARAEVAARTRADEWSIAGGRKGMDSAAGMNRSCGVVKHLGASLWGRSISLMLDRTGPVRGCRFRSVNVSQTDGDR